MLYMEIGEIEAFKCVEAFSEECHCDGCVFFNEYEGCVNVAEPLGPCNKDDRLDKKDVIFVSTDPNEIIRERIERQIDRFNDNGFVRIAFKEGDCICLKASFMKDYLFTLLEVLPEPKEEKEESKC